MHAYFGNGIIKVFRVLLHPSLEDGDKPVKQTIVNYNPAMQYKEHQTLVSFYVIFSYRPKDGCD